MTTLVVHGPLANGNSWYQSSWGERGFLTALQKGMLEADGRNDIWAVDGRPVESYPELGGVFEWDGLPAGIYRGLAAMALAEYLNTVAALTDEPIRIIAHCHGCNVVKLASSLDALSPAVYIEQAVFLACPHFHETEYTRQQLSWEDQFVIRMDSQSCQATGRRYRCRVNSPRFGRILNLYCEKDEVQVDLAQSLPGGEAPLTGGMPESPAATRWDLDDQAAHLYEDVEVQVEPQCDGKTAHSVMHGSSVGRLAGEWLNSRASIETLIQVRGGLPALSRKDTGA